MTTKVKNSVYHYRAPVKDPIKANLYKILSDEDCGDFYTYIDWLDLSKKGNIIVLPVSNHYFYHPDDFASTETLINLKCLNQISDLESFLGKIHRSLPDDCFFTGCFLNTARENNVNNNNSRIKKFNLKIPLSRYKVFFEKFILMMNLRKVLRFQKERVRSILNEIGFMVLDMTELNGKTYFCAKKQTV